MNLYLVRRGLDLHLDCIHVRLFVGSLGRNDLHLRTIPTTDVNLAIDIVDMDAAIRRQSGAMSNLLLHTALGESYFAVATHCDGHEGAVNCGHSLHSCFPFREGDIFTKPPSPGLFAWILTHHCA